MGKIVAKNIFLFSILLCGCLQDQPAPNRVKAVKEQHTMLKAEAAVVISEPSCPPDMVYINKSHFCIDRYEAPNQKGAYPLYAQTAYQAVAYCQQQDKMLCTTERWYFACVGPKRMRYPYGNSYHKGTCNDDKVGWTPVPWHEMSSPAWIATTKRLYKGEPSGSRSACVSGYGVYDMTGNVAEWVKDTHAHYGYVVKGGYWYGVMFDTPSCRFTNIGHSPDFRSYEFGFRCCKEVN